MARYVKSFIGGLTSRVSGGDTAEAEEPAAMSPSPSPLVSIEVVTQDRAEAEEDGAGEGGDEPQPTLGTRAGDETGPEDSQGDPLERVEVSPVASVSSGEEPRLSTHEDSNEEDSLEFEEAPSQRGSLLKWTNYLRGWQERYFVVRDGVLSYFKSEIDTKYGCRGSVSLHKVKILVRACVITPRVHVFFCVARIDKGQLLGGCNMKYQQQA